MKKTRDEMKKDFIEWMVENWGHGGNPGTDEQDSTVADYWLSIIDQERGEYEKIFSWLLGEHGDFPNLSQKPHYRFRTELRKKLSLLSTYNKEK